MMNFKMRRGVKLAAGQLALGASLVIGTLPSTATALTLSDLPLFLVDSVPPNVVLSMDDSGSMGLAYIPDNIWPQSALNAAKSTYYNRIYYDPTAVYAPPLNADGSAMSNATFTAALTDPYGDGNDQTRTLPTSVNLATSFRPLWHVGNYSTGRPLYSGVAEPAYYYNYDAANGGCDGDPTTDACYTKVVVAGSSEEQNFANWYQYYSYRMKSAKGSISFAFSPENLPSSIRVGRQTINQRGVRSGNSSGTVSYVNEFGSAERTNFYNWLFNVNASGGTPLRRAQITIGDYYATSGNNSPYVVDPGGSAPGDQDELSCRLNTHIMVTDGVYNQGHGTPAQTPFRHDYDSFSLPAGKAYDSTSVEASIYADNEITDPNITGANVTPLSDFAFHYWATDLRPDLENNVKPYLPAGSSTANNINNTDYWNPANDPATWQHLVNYTIGFGVAGYVPLTSAVYDSLKAGTSFVNNFGDNQTEWNPITTYPGWQRQDALARVDDLYHTAINSRGQFFAASSPDELSNALSKIVNSLSARVSSAAAVDLNSSSIAGGVGLYQAKFQTDTWEGNILGRPISDGSGTGSCNSLPIGTVCQAVWDAGTLNTKTSLDWNNRIIFTSQPESPLGFRGNKFRWPTPFIDTTRQNLLHNGDSLGKERLEYLRGNTALEQQNGGTFRNRSETRLGAIVHSSPMYVGNGFEASGAFDILYPDDLEGAGGQTHSEFLCAGPQDTDSNGTIDSCSSGTFNRTPMLYVGANDGMLHAFDARINVATGGREKFAYVPDLVFDDLWKLTSQSFVNGSYVDGDLVHADTFYDAAWHTLLVGGVRTGGQGFFALDVTNPDAITTEDNTLASQLVRWEFGDTNTASGIADGDTGANGDPDMGFSYSKPVITKVNLKGSDASSANPSSTGRWVVIFGNGYNAMYGDGATSATGNAVLFVVDAETGALIKKLDTGVGLGDGQDPTQANGLSSPAAVFNDDDLTTDYVYAGDLFGNLWKFDISSEDLADWKIAYSDASGPAPLFEAQTTKGIAQPIQSTPRVGGHPSRRGGNMIYFGTGQYLDPADNTTTALQAFYGIWDKDLCGTGTACADLAVGDTKSHVAPVNLSVDHLLQQSISQESSGKRVTTDLPIEWEGGNAKMGWYLQLAAGAGSPVLTGERMVGRSVLRGRTIVFTTVIPSDNPCEAGGTSWLMALDRSDGGLAPAQPFDHNGDGVLDSDDYLNNSKTSGIQGELSGDGVYSDPTVIRCGSGDCYYVGTSEGEVKSGFSGEGFSQGRRRWRQLN